ncbi:MAG TPA: PilT/PilU family type 4a pilus ATPase [Acidimicrobiales bacterium]|nr:PilT/PilU family type 4a pilus ATPase [Acidimicrobiales bacterium]
MSDDTVEVPPAGPNPAGPNPAGPNPAGPNPAGPNPGPNPAGPNPAGPNPAPNLAPLAGAPAWIPVEANLDGWLALLAAGNGSDILLTAGSPPYLRIDGNLKALDIAPLYSDDIEAILGAQVGAEPLARFREQRELDFSFSWRNEARVRGNAFYQRDSPSVALRRIPRHIPSTTDIGLPPVVERVMRNPSGLILVTGATGSGKSTTLATMIDVVNSYRGCHIVTIEDPIEYLHDNKLAAISQREIGTDTHSFHHALRSVLREDPDVVLVGEIRDPESIAAALTIAETGHLVLTTLHTNDSAQALDRIVDVFPAERRPQIQVQLAGTLLAVIYQRLIPRVDVGMVAAYEVMVGVPAVRNLVREGKTRQLRNVVATHRGDGMQTLEVALATLIDAGVIDYQAAVNASLYPQEIPKPPPAQLSRSERKHGTVAASAR